MTMRSIVKDERVNDRVINRLQNARNLNEEYMRRFPNEHRFRVVKSALDKIERIVLDHWPFTPEEKERVDIPIS